MFSTRTIFRDKPFCKKASCVSAVSSPRCEAAGTVRVGSCSWHRTGLSAAVPLERRDLSPCAPRAGGDLVGMVCAPRGGTGALPWKNTSIVCRVFVPESPLGKAGFPLRWVSEEVPFFSPFQAGSLSSVAFCKRFCLPRLWGWVVLDPSVPLSLLQVTEHQVPTARGV